MKRIGYLFEKLIDKENIRQAIHNACKGKSEYRIVKRIKANPEKYVERISNLLKEGKFIHSPYTLKNIHEKGKLREIKKTKFYPDRIIHHAVIQVMEPILLKHFIVHTYQSIKGRGVHKAIKYANKVVRNKDVTHALVLDIVKFYPSLSNDEIMNMMYRLVKDKRMLEVLRIIVYSTDGLPIGNYTSQPLGNITLSRLDHFIKEELQLKYYVRYADDILILSNDVTRLHEAKKAIEAKLTDLGLKVKHNHQVFDISARKPDFLGYVLTREGLRVRKKIKFKFIRLMTKNHWTHKSICSLVSYLGWLNHANTRRLKAKYFTEEVCSALKQYGTQYTLPKVIIKELR